MSLSDHRPLRDKIYLKKIKDQITQQEQQEERERETKKHKKTTQRNREATRKNRKEQKDKRRKGQEEERAQTLNLQILENLIQFIQSDLCGISDCENRSTETCRSGNEDYQPL